VRDWTAYSLEEVERCHGFNVRPLYTAPPQRKEWQGLTDEEATVLWGWEVGKSGYNRHELPARFARAIEAKLREKNA
jgi:hypothetical protein